MCCNDTNSSMTTNASFIDTELYTCRDSVISAQTYNTIITVISCGLVPSFFLLGAPANILSIIVFYRQGLRDRMNLCLFCLTITDFIYVVVNFLMSSLCFLGVCPPGQEQPWQFNLIIYSMNFLYGSAYSSGCLTMIIAVERCVCVMFPMKAANLISTKTMAIILFVTILFIQILCSVYIIKQKVITVKTDANGQYLTMIVYTDLYLTYGFLAVIENIVLSCIAIGTFVCVLLATVITVIRLNTAQAWRKSISSHAKGQGMLMRMLVAVSCVYILCTAPNVTLALTRFTVPEFRADGSYCNVFSSLHMVANCVVMFNSSINFFVYLSMSSRFRDELKSMSLFWSCDLTRHPVHRCRPMDD